MFYWCSSSSSSSSSSSPSVSSSFFFLLLFFYIVRSILGVGSRHLPPGATLQERYLRGCSQCCRLCVSPCLSSLPGSLSVSFTQESSCSLSSKHSFYYYLHNVTTPYTFTHSLQINLLLTVFFTWSGNKWDFFFNVFVFPLSQYPFNVY